MPDKKYIALTKEQIKKLACKTEYQQNKMEVALLQAFLNANNFTYASFCTMSGYMPCSKGSNALGIDVWDSRFHTYDICASLTSLLLKTRTRTLCLDLSKEWIETQYNAYGEPYLSDAKKSLEYKKEEYKTAIKQIDKKLDNLIDLQAAEAKQ